MKSEARTWTLRHATDGALCAWEHKDGLPGVEVIELEPLADLLEELIDAARYAPEFFVEKWGIDKTVEQAVAILKAHGRLSEEEGKGL